MQKLVLFHETDMAAGHVSAALYFYWCHNYGSCSILKYKNEEDCQGFIERVNDNIFVATSL